MYREELTDLADQYSAGTLDSTEYKSAIETIMNRTDAETRNRVKDALLELKPNLYGFEVDSGKQDMITGKSRSTLHGAETPFIPWMRRKIPNQATLFI